MRILHLSDLHVSSEYLGEMTAFVVDPFLQDVKKYHIEKKFDIVLLTGDIIDKGASAFKDKTVATRLSIRL